MIIRKFVIQVVAKFTDKGFREADKDMAKLKVRASELTKEFNALTRAQIAAAQAAKRAAQAADDEEDELARLQARISKLDESIDDLNKSIGKKRKRLDELSKRSLKDVGASLNGASERLNKFKSALAPIGEAAMMAGRAIAAVTAAGVAVGAGVIKVGTSFEVLRARLKTVEGSAMGAERAFAQIQQFTKTTPFQLEEVTTAFVRLKSLGLDASQRSLSSFGNLAAAQGKSIIDFIEAVADASTGEFERLKEFGIKASSQGEQVAFTFKGTTTTVGKNADEIQAFLRGLGETEFAGAMDEQMKTAAGAISNLKDTFSTFLDQVAQMGVLDEFKGLLGDVSKAAGGRGFAGIIAEGLVTALKALREALANVTEQDIRDFLSAAVDLAKSLASALGLVTSAIELFTLASGNSSDALKNMTLAVLALVTAFTGPAGLTVAAAAVGTVMGRMLANVIADIDGTNESLDRLDRRIAKLTANIEEREARIAAIENRTQETSEKTRRLHEEQRKKRGERLERQAGGLGAGLINEGLTEEERGFQAQFIENTEEQARGLSGVTEGGVFGALAGAAQGRAKVLGSQGEAARAALFTDAGRQVYEGVRKAEAKKIAEVERRARREARKAGKTASQIESAASQARSAAEDAALANRRKAFEAAQKTFTETGSAEAATLAGERQVAGRGKKGAPKKGKSDVFFDFEKKAAQAAKTQAESFAEDELQRLISEGVASKDAIAQAQAAGKKRAEDLEKQFIEAGRIFDASAKSVLDLLGLRGPGSVLEGRPPPQTLIISPVFNVTMIENFNQTNEGVTGATALAEVTGEGGRVAVEEGLKPSMEFINKLVNDAFALKMQEIANALGGGRVAPGPQG